MYCSYCTHTHMQPNSTPPPTFSSFTFSSFVQVVGCVYCIDHVPPNPQDGRTPLMLAAGEGHLPVARLLVETYKCDVNEEDSNVSGWELMGGVSEHSTCVSSHMWPSNTGSWNTRSHVLCLIVIWDVFTSQIPTSKCVYVWELHVEIAL